MIDYLL